MTKNKKLQNWVQEIADLCRPDAIHWCDGSQKEYDDIAQQAVKNGTYVPLNPAKRPNCFWVKSDPGDVARVEDRTYICSKMRIGRIILPSSCGIIRKYIGKIDSCHCTLVSNCG